MHITSNLNDGYLGSGKHLQYSIKKYGKENFKREILIYTETRELLIELEKLIVNEQLIKDMLCMNIMTGGHGGFGHLTDDQKSELSKKANLALKFKLQNDLDFSKKYYENRKLARLSGDKHHWHINPNHSGWFAGKCHTEESKRKIGEANSTKQKGELNSQFGKKWIYNINLKQNKRVKKEQLEEYLNTGWNIGLIKEFNKKVDPRIKSRQFDL